MKDHNVRERIITTASRLFYTQGYQATGINQVIEEAQVAKSSLYQHFTSKEVLLNAYLSEHRQGWRARLKAFTADMAPGKEKLLGLFAYRAFVAEENNYKGCTFCRISYELPNLDEVSATIIREHKTFVKEFIATQLQVMKIPEDEMGDLTDMLFNLSEGAVLMATVFGNPAPLQSTARSVKKIISEL